MSQPFTTRAQAAEYQGLDPRVIEAMCERAYEAGKASPSSLPPWKAVNPSYQAAIRREIVAAVKYAETAGYLTVNHRGAA